MATVTLYFETVEPMDAADTDAIDQLFERAGELGLRFSHATDRDGEGIDLDDDICATDGCGESLLDGQGWNGYCGDCADAHENEEGEN